MQIQPINSQPHQSFGFKFKLSKEAIEATSSSTGLNEYEMTRLPLEEARKLMIERGTLKLPSNFKLWLSRKYQEFGIKHGLLKKHYDMYTEID